MFVVMLPLVAVLVLAVFVYVGRERMGLQGLGMAALRTAGLGAVIVLFLNPGRTVRIAGEAPVVLLDASLSMAAAGGQWQAALDTARSLAGTRGMVLRFGSATAPFDTASPVDGGSRLGGTVGVARARDRPVVVVTDGEIEDVESIPGSLLEGVVLVVLPRDTVVNASVITVEARPRAERDDSIRIETAIGLWGVDTEVEARLEVFEAGRRLASEATTLLPVPSIARRRLILPPGTLSVGLHVLRVRVTAPGDREPRDDERLVVVEVSEQPGVVVIADPPDWEGRFLVSELTDIVRSSVRGYARIAGDRWLDMTTLSAIAAPTVVRAARGAGLLVLRGRADAVETGPRQAVWYWPGGSDDRPEFFPGDWYLTEAPGASPIAGRIARIEWDSLPPLLGLVPLVARSNEWVALTARQGRRGPERPVLIGRDSAGIRTLTTAGAGMWRWGFRGGAAREAYRALLATGSDWLLGSSALRRRVALSSSPTVARGEPIVFRWAGDSVPDSLAVRFTGDAGSDTTSMLRFGTDGVALFAGPPDVYRWSVVDNPQLRGVAVVENYSPEFAPRRVWMPPAGEGTILRLVERYARESWWLFVFAVVAFAGEWAWRYRCGLP